MSRVLISAFAAALLALLLSSHGELHAQEGSAGPQSHLTGSHNGRGGALTVDAQQ